MKSEKNSTQNRIAFIVLTSLFFMWGFITCMNDILIPFLKKMFALTYFQSMLVQFSFFGAYFVGSVIYFIISSTSGDPILKIGYKKGIIVGLLISGISLIIFWPAAALHSYGMFLGALFILGLGFTLLQITANPFVAALGNEKGASSRLNLAQGFNSLGTTIAPIIGGYLVFHYFAKFGQPLLNSVGKTILTDDGVQMTAFSVQVPYLIFALFFFIIAVIVYKTPLPKVIQNKETNLSAGALQYRNLVLGMGAIFLYVGAEVGIGSMMINYIKEQLNCGEMLAKSFLAFYWGGAMIGRFIGSLALSDKVSSFKKNLLMPIISLSVFFLIYGIVFIESGFEFSFINIFPFLIFIALNILAFIIGNSLPHRTLSIFAFVNIMLLVVAILSSGAVSMWCLVGIGLFNSIMWSNIFTLSIHGLGKYTGQGSSLLVMMVLGGAILPLIQGWIADIYTLHISYIIPIFSYIYLAYFGILGYKPTKWKRYKI